MSTELNVDYFGDFYKMEEADQLFLELYKLRFDDINICIRGRQFTPARKMCAYGDDNLVYSFSGTTATARPWTPMLRKLKEQVEAKAGTQYNFVLLNLYEDGNARIGLHRDDEKQLDVSASIATLSFGAERRMVFQRKNFNDVNYDLAHGSLLFMNPPTNKYWAHQIPSQPEVQKPRISLTFRRMLFQQDYLPAKRQCVDGDLPDSDWLTQAVYNNSTLYDDVASTDFQLSKEVVCCVTQFNGDARVDIRRYKYVNKRWIPTKQGIVAKPLTWFKFIRKIFGFNFIYKDASFIANNSLLCLNHEGLHLQNINCIPNNPCEVKQCFITLKPMEVTKLLEIREKISERLIELMWENILPLRISQIYANIKPPSCKDTVSAYINHIENNLATVLKTVWECNGCIADSCSQHHHDCIHKSAADMFETVGSDAWLLLDINALADDLHKEIPYVDINVVKDFTMDTYKNLIFVKKE